LISEILIGAESSSECRSSSSKSQSCHPSSSSSFLDSFRFLFFPTVSKALAGASS
jgi:hypothetical protein